jgi:hypothetical protein
MHLHHGDYSQEITALASNLPYNKRVRRKVADRQFQPPARWEERDQPWTGALFRAYARTIPIGSAETFRQVTYRAVRSLDRR